MEYLISLLAYTLRYLDTVLQLEIMEEAVPAMQPVFDFFNSHFRLGAGYSSTCDVTLHIYPYTDFQRNHFVEAIFSPIVIRKSSASDFNLYGDKAVLPNEEIIDSPHTGTAVVFHAEDNMCDLYISKGSKVQVIELIRDIVIKLEESRGSLILHASSAVKDGMAYALVGSKGAGKSTLLFDLVGHQGYDFLTGDKLFLRIGEEGIVAYGWPDYPHVGYGTILGYPILVENLQALGHQIDPAQSGKKILFSAECLQKSLGFSYVQEPMPLYGIIFPNVQGVGNTSIQLLESVDSSLVLEHLEFSSENPFAHWHGFLNSIPHIELASVEERLGKLLQNCKYVSIVGQGPLTAQQMEVLL